VTCRFSTGGRNGRQLAGCKLVLSVEDNHGQQGNSFAVDSVLQLQHL
jgi:hypothetical protein